MTVSVTCGGKTKNGYSQKSEADYAADNMAQYGATEEFASYWCERCKLYHIAPKSRMTACSDSFCTDSTGGYKKAYPTFEDASRRAAILLKEQGVRLKVYRCSTCGKFHLTSSDGPKRGGRK